MHHFSNQRKSLKSARAEIIQQKQGGKIAEFPVIGQGQHGPKPFQVDVLRADLMASGSNQLPDRTQRRFRFFLYNIQQRPLRLFRIRVHQIQNYSLIFSDDAGMRIRGEIPYGSGMPMVASGPFVDLIHARLDHGPIPVRTENKGVQINLESVGNRIVVDACGETAGSNERLPVQVPFLGDGAQFIRRLARVLPPAAANVKAQLIRTGGKASFQSTHYRSCNA